MNFYHFFGKKSVRLVLFGIVAFFLIFILISSFLVPFKGKEQAKEKVKLFMPTFVGQFYENFPGEVTVKNKYKVRDVKILISGNSFSETEALISPHNLVRFAFRNDDNIIHNIIIVSPEIDGSYKTMAETVLRPGEIKEIHMYVPSALPEIVKSGKVKLIKSENNEAYLIFNLICTINCGKENSTLRIYSPIDYKSD